jgi:hypothetical protein
VEADAVDAVEPPGVLDHRHEPPLRMWEREGGWV